MSCSNLTTWAAPKLSLLPDFNSLSSRSLTVPSHSVPASPSPSFHHVSSTTMHCSFHELCERIDCVKNTQKITEAMFFNGPPCPGGHPRPSSRFSTRSSSDIDIPLTQVLPVEKIALVVVTDDHGLRGGFNNYIIKKAESCLTDYGLRPSLPFTDDDHHLPASSSLFYGAPETRHPRSRSFSPHSNVYNSVSSSSSSLARPPSKTLSRSTVPTSPSRNALCSTRRNPGRHQEEWRVQPAFGGEEQPENYGLRITSS